MQQVHMCFITKGCNFTHQQIPEHCSSLLQDLMLVFMMVKFGVEVFCIVTPCNVVIVYQRFKGTCCLHLQGEVKGGSTDLWNIGFLPQHCMVSQTRRPQLELFLIVTREFLWCWELNNLSKVMLVCIGLIPQPRSPTKCMWIEKSIKEGQGPQIRTVEASWKKKKLCLCLIKPHTMKIYPCA